MFTPSNLWPDTPAGRGTKFFAQAMRSFLDKNAFEGFRAYSLDTMGRLKEAEELIRDIQARRVKDAALKPVLDELAWSIGNDDAAISLAPAQCQILIDLSKEQKTQKQVISYSIRQIRRLLSGSYRQRLIDNIVNSVNADRRIEILSSTGYLASNLLNDGFSRAFLIESIDSKFFVHPVKRAGASVVRSFLASLADHRKKWIVVHTVNETAKSLVSSFDDWMVCDVSEFPAHVQDAVSKWPKVDKKPICAARRSHAADPFQAADNVDEELEQIKSLRILAADVISPSWSENSYVYAPRANRGLDLVDYEEPLLGEPSDKPLSGHRLRQAKNLAERLYGNFEGISKDRITRALSTAAVSLESPQDEIRLTSLWSAFEVLLGDPHEDNSRISHFVNALAPCVSIRYHRRLFVTLHDYVAVHYGRKFRSLLRNIPIGLPSNQHTKLCKLVVIDSNKGVFQDLLSMCSDNPLLIHRLWRINKFYSEPKLCLKSILGHHERVGWQINRLYRIRNSLAHAGISPSYTDTLVINALEYLRSAVMTIVRKSAKENASRDLDQTIAEIGFEWNAMIKRLDGAKGVGFDEELAHFVFSAF